MTWTRSRLTRARGSLVERRDGPLHGSSARRRISAYVYGNVTVLGAVATVDLPGIASGAASVVVLATAASTFAAHILADAVAERVDAVEAPDPHGFLRRMRDSTPIVTSGVAPAAVLGLATLDLVAPAAALPLAGALVVVRLALTGPMVERFRGHPVSPAAVWGGLVLALLGTLIVGLKVYAGQ